MRPAKRATRHPSATEALATEPAVSIVPARTSEQVDAFIQFQFELYRGDPNFVPPIIAERRDFLDRRRNPLFQHADGELFLAVRDGRVVGRVAALNDPQYNQFHNTDYGFFGLFESHDDSQIAGALLDAAAQWIRTKGNRTMLGPVNLSFNQDCGVLIDGFEHPPAMMMPYNPRYYGALLASVGFAKAKDLFTYELSASVAPPERVVRIGEKARSLGATVRPLRMNELQAEIRRIKSIYNSMAERNFGFGFVPMSEEEFDAVAARLRPLVQIRPELCLIAELHGEPVGFSLTMPDSNPALRAAQGRLTRFGLPIGLARMAWAARKRDRVRVLMLGIRQGFRRRGIDALLCLETLRAARLLGYSGGEIGWASEDNELINRVIEAMGARKYRTYRVFERSV